MHAYCCAVLCAYVVSEHCSGRDVIKVVKSWSSFSSVTGELNCAVPGLYYVNPLK